MRNKKKPSKHWLPGYVYNTTKAYAHQKVCDVCCNKLDKCPMFLLNKFMWSTAVIRCTNCKGTMVLPGCRFIGNQFGPHPKSFYDVKIYEGRITELE